jgi:hypothetical protein
VTIAIRPSVGRNGGGYRSDLGIVRTEIFLREGLDRLMGDLRVGPAREFAGDALHRDGLRRLMDARHEQAQGCVV